MTMQRRRLFTLAPVGAALALAGCGASVSTATVATLAADVDAVAGGLAAIVPQITSLAGLPPQTVASLIAALAGVQSAAAKIKAANDPTGSATVDAVKMFAGAVNAIVQAAAAIPIIPEPVHLGLLAASVLLPVIEGLAGIVAAPAGPGAMPPDAARLILVGLAQGAR